MDAIRKDGFRALIAPPVHEHTATERLVREMNRLGAATDGRLAPVGGRPPTPRG